MLFIEGQQPEAFLSSVPGRQNFPRLPAEGKAIITKLSDAGDVLGLNSVVSNRPYEVTAEMMEPGQANFISRDSWLQFLKDNGEVALRVAEQLSRNYMKMTSGGYELRPEIIESAYSPPFHE